MNLPKSRTSLALRVQREFHISEVGFQIMALIPTKENEINY